ncbi:hypothetical protein FOZ63_022192 [Perkinsus olseni]|uniref:Uncharacterized protein n=1 Tax=Perkinsus olseni TaxID=32597 RepID=A0A7J6PNT7_PEROL|nr:hypothetical protein FOZ62_029651 [Perkinsus olseni]KAF4697745.1 hypothetical protein FOZ60_000089 [Perkinsus olseni]KAF4709733.1 hypothetical protein FOZ63_022192 [Perkinsus olseni]
MASSASSHQSTEDDVAALDAWERALKNATSEALATTVHRNQVEALQGENLSLRQYLETVQREADQLRDSVTDLKEEIDAMRQVLATKDKVHVDRVDNLLQEVSALRGDNERMALLSADAETVKVENDQLKRRNTELEQEMNRLRSSNTALSSQLMQVMSGDSEGSFGGRPIHEEDEEELSLAEASDDPKVILEILNRQRARAQTRETELVEQIERLTERIGKLSTESSSALGREPRPSSTASQDERAAAATSIGSQLKNRVQNISAQSGIADLAGRFFG